MTSQVLRSYWQVMLPPRPLEMLQSLFKMLFWTLWRMTSDSILIWESVYDTEWCHGKKANLVKAPFHILLWVHLNATSRHRKACICRWGNNIWVRQQCACCIVQCQQHNQKCATISKDTTSSFYYNRLWLHTFLSLLCRILQYFDISATSCQTEFLLVSSWRWRDIEHWLHRNAMSMVLSNSKHLAKKSTLLIPGRLRNEHTLDTLVNFSLPKLISDKTPSSSCHFQLKVLLANAEMPPWQWPKINLCCTSLMIKLLPWKHLNPAFWRIFF